MAKNYYANQFNIQLSRFMAEAINNDYFLDLYAGFALFSALKYQVRAGKKVGGEPTSEAEEAAEEDALAYDLKKRDDYIDMIHDHLGWSRKRVLNQLKDWAFEFSIWNGNPKNHSPKTITSTVHIPTEKSSK